MATYGGIVDSYAVYRADPGLGADPAVPDFSTVLPQDGIWCHVDEKVRPDMREWSPSVCTSDRVDAADEEQAAAALLETRRFAWPQQVEGWQLAHVRHDVVMDERPEGDDDGAA